MSSTITLQRPKDISLSEIEGELNKIWISQGSGDAAMATRAATFSMVIYEPEEFQQLLGAIGVYTGPIDGIHGPETRSSIRGIQQGCGLPITGRVDTAMLDHLRQDYANRGSQRAPNLDMRGFTVSEAIAARNPSRIITLCPTLGPDEGVTAQVSAYCPVQKSKSRNLVCCEYITLRGTKEALERVGDLVVSLLIPNLPKFVWWKATPNPEQGLFQSLSSLAHCLILDSCYFSDPEAEFLKMHESIEKGIYVADLNWHRLSPWQELTAGAFDPPERRAALGEIDKIVIDYEKGNDAQALLFLGWFASRLHWQPIAYTTDSNGFYDLQHVRFQDAQGKEIHGELAAIPMADIGEIPGDLIGLQLSSNNPDADCCTILCSETTGCMRMEAGGGAQNCRTEQVTALPDQKAEALMSQQLQRWGREVLFEESLSVAVQILGLRR